MESLYIADDEKIIRDGLKFVVDWEEMGFEIVGEAGNGDDAYRDIQSLRPTIVMMDIKMPGQSGLDVIRKCVEENIPTKFIILSGYSDFQYAREAMKYGVTHYLTKPIDEDELTKAVNEISVAIQDSRAKSAEAEVLREKSRKEIIADILNENVDYYMLDLNALGLNANRYQIIGYESFDQNDGAIPWQFSDLFMAASKGTELFDHFSMDGTDYLLLKGNLAIEKFKRFAAHYEDEPEKGSPLDTLFIAYGCEVVSVSELPKSYDQVRLLMKRRFFCHQGQHLLSFDELPDRQGKTPVKPDREQVKFYSDRIAGYIEAVNRRQMAQTLYELEEKLYGMEAEITEIKVFMTDIILSIKEKLSRTYYEKELPFKTNTQIINFINNCNFLYEIVLYFSGTFEEILGMMGNSTRDSIMDDIIYYIEHNYQSNLRLETIATLFGYNSSYLGKIFNRTQGESFNVFVDRMRVRRAQELLSNKDLKVYEIAEKVGYKNVDYFHKKFRKYVGQSPAEYRKAMNIEAED